MKLYELPELQKLILEWADERDLLHRANATKQRLKLIEECGELASAILKNDVEKQKDAIGDIFVVLVILNKQLDSYLIVNGFHVENVFDNEVLLANIINEYVNKSMTLSSWQINSLCLNLNLNLVECANIAYEEIKNRKGKTINGTFIKDEN